MSFVALRVFMFSCLFCRGVNILKKIAIRTNATHAYLKMDVFRPFNFCCIHIRTLVVVYNRAVIQDQRHVCLVVLKGIMREGLTSIQKVSRQKQCLPTYQHQLMLFESASCKNSETNCLKPRCKFELNGLPIKFISNAHNCTCAFLKFSCTADVTDSFEIWIWNHTARNITSLYICLYSKAHTHFQVSWMAQEKFRKAASGHGSGRHHPCSRHQPAGSSSNAGML